MCPGDIRLAAKTGLPRYDWGSKACYSYELEQVQSWTAQRLRG